MVDIVYSKSPSGNKSKSDDNSGFVVAGLGLLVTGALFLWNKLKGGKSSSLASQLDDTDTDSGSGGVFWSDLGGADVGEDSSVSGSGSGFVSGGSSGYSSGSGGSVIPDFASGSGSGSGSAVMTLNNAKLSKVSKSGGGLMDYSNIDTSIINNGRGLITNVVDEDHWDKTGTQGQYMLTYADGSQAGLAIGGGSVGDVVQNGVLMTSDVNLAIHEQEMFAKGGAYYNGLLLSREEIEGLGYSNLSNAHVSHQSKYSDELNAAAYVAVHGSGSVVPSASVPVPDVSKQHVETPFMKVVGSAYDTVVNFVTGGRYKNDVVGNNVVGNSSSNSSSNCPGSSGSAVGSFSSAKQGKVREGNVGSSDGGSSVPVSHGSSGSSGSRSRSKSHGSSGSGSDSSGSAVSSINDYRRGKGRRH